MVWLRQTTHSIYLYYHLPNWIDSRKITVVEICFTINYKDTQGMSECLLWKLLPSDGLKRKFEVIKCKRLCYQLWSQKLIHHIWVSCTTLNLILHLYVPEFSGINNCFELLLKHNPNDTVENCFFFQFSLTRPLWRPNNKCGWCFFLCKYLYQFF